MLLRSFLVLPLLLCASCGDPLTEEHDRCGDEAVDLAETDKKAGVRKVSACYESYKRAVWERDNPEEAERQRIEREAREAQSQADREIAEREFKDRILTARRLRLSAEQACQRRFDPDTLEGSIAMQDCEREAYMTYTRSRQEVREEMISDGFRDPDEFGLIDLDNVSFY
ncbi:hypothetical protein K3152_08635 [Qipengyuania sp. 1NDH17]|uniref:DUF1311 domain-containing protein n=1 Tax=Qipengyuania polymorpha TaxID=2867234 RepID=A0ABS7IZ22_9SPHN|nr:hypothetical protein [Qipengyuania polymorpha]MBX7458309.1 hypothetical protein [Qipengyuania polymorpha]